MKPIRVLDRKGSWSETNRLLSEFVNDYFRKTSATKAVDILEAGCGTQWNLNLEIGHELTGVDLSREAMEIRKERYGDLDHFVVGDLATVPIDSGAFDIVYSSYVLEHVKGAEAILDRFFDWLRPGGLAILIFPDRDSVFGFVTRMTPHWFHIFYYKHIEKFAHAGEPGRGPFPTEYDPVVSRRGIHEYCRVRGYEIALEFATPISAPSQAGFMGPVIMAGVKSIAVASLGRLTARHGNLALIIRKP